MQIDKNVFKGMAQLTLYDIQEDGSLKEHSTYTQTNKICKRVLELLLNRQVVFDNKQDNYERYQGITTYTSGRRIGLFSNQEIEKFSRTTASVIAVGDHTFVDDNYTRTAASDTEPANVVYSNRFLAPTNERTVYSLGICEEANTRSYDPSFLTLDILTYLLLNTPIIQATNQVLDVNYKVFIDWNASTVDVNYNGQREIERLFLGEPVANPMGLEKNQFIHGATIDNPGVNLFNYWYNTNLVGYTNILGNLAIGQDLFNLTNRFGAVGKPFVGSFATGLQYGGFLKHNPTVDSHLGREYFNKTSNLSSVYSHSSDANFPMYDGNKLANSSWQPVITDDNVTKEFPAVYALKVSKDGGVGVGEYKIYKTGWGGWSGNRYSYPIGCPFLNFDLSLYFNEKDNPDNPVTTDFDCYNHRWNYTWSYTSNEHYFVSYVRNVGIALHKLTSESFEVIKKYKLSDTPAMDFFIEDIEVLPQEELIYVATKGGLFKIDTSTDTITQESSDRCVAVVVGYLGKVFGVFITQNGTDGSGNPTYTGRISSSDSYSIALPDGAILASVDLPVFENTWRLFINKESINFEMMLVVGREPKGLWRTLPNGDRYLYDIFWRNELEYVKKERVSILSDRNSIRYSDLMCFPSNNTVVCDNNIWIYPSVKYYTKNKQQVRYQFDFNHGEDVKQDFIDNNWNTREANYYPWVKTSYINNNPSAYLWPINSTLNLSVPNASKISIARFAQAPLREFYTLMDGVGDIFKGYEGEGNQYKITLLMETWIKYTTPTYDPNTGLQDVDGRLEGTDLDSIWTSANIGEVIRVSYIVNIDLDLDTDTVEVEVRGGSETIPRDSISSSDHPDYGSLRRTSDKQIIVFPKVGKVCSRGFYMLSPLKYPARDLAETLIQAYSWDGTDWIKDNTNTGPGRPLHTSNEEIVNGLSVRWQDLAPTDSQDLILDQYYTFTRTTAANMIPIEDHTPNFSFYYWWGFRRRVEKIISTVVPSNRTIFVPEAPDGINPDIEWHALGGVGFSDLQVKVSLNGEEIPVQEKTNVPPAGTVYCVRDLGRLLFNSVDVGKTADIEYTYYLKYDDTEE